jgi:antitoxin component of MazEF toxin-antitoxin module
MVQKIIQSGSSAGVTIPKKQLQEMGLRVGDEVKITVEPAKAQLKKFADELDKFMDLYDEDLKNLAKR